MKIGAFEIKFTRRKNTNNANVDSPEFWRAMMDGLAKLATPIGATNEVYITDGYCYNPTVYACVNYIAGKIAGLEWQLFEVKDEKALKRYKAAVEAGNNMNVSKFKSQALEEVDGEHDLLKLIKRPNPLQGKQEYFMQLVGHELITGNTYMLKAGPDNGVNAGIPKQLYVLPSQITTLKLGTATQPIEGYYVQNGEEQVRFDPADICHLKMWNPGGMSFNSAENFYGMSPIKAGRNTISVDNDGMLALMTMSRNMGVNGMLALKDQTPGFKFDEKKARELENKYYQKYGTPKNAGRLWVTPGIWEWHQIGMSPVDLGILQAGVTNMRNICNLYNLNSSIFNDPDNKVHNTMKEAKKSAWHDACAPHANNLRDEMNRFLVPPFEERDKKDYYLTYDELAIMEIQEDLEKLVSIAKDAHMLTPDEQRAMLGHGALADEFPAMGVPHMPANLIRVDEVDPEPEE